MIAILFQQLQRVSRLLPFALLIAGLFGMGGIVATVSSPVLAFPFILAALVVVAALAIPHVNTTLKFTFPTVIAGLFILYTFQDIIIVNLNRFGIPLAGLFKKSDEGILLLAAGAAFLRSIYTGRQLRLNPILIFPILLIMWSLICMIYNDVPKKIAFLDIFLLVKGYLVLFIAMNVAGDKSPHKPYINMIIFFLIGVLIIESIQLPFPKLAKIIFGVEPMMRTGSVRPTGPFEHPGTLGTFLGFAANLMFGIAYSYRSKKAWIIYFMAIGGLVISLTIRQLLGHVVGVIVFLAFVDRKTLMIGIGAGLAMAPLAWPFMAKNIANVKRNYVTYQGDTVRTQAYLVTGRILDDSPIFGVGPGRFGGYVSIINNSDEYGRRQFDWINQELYSLDAYWPHIFSECGVPGGVMFLALLATMLALSLQHTHKKYRGLTRAFAISCFVGMWVSLIDSTFSTFFENTFACLMFFSQWGLFLGSYDYQKERFSTTKPNP